MTVSAASSTSSATTTSSTSSSSTASSTMSSSDFLNLLLSELQNQDPLDATSTTDFRNQLPSYPNSSSFSSLVTLNSVNYIGHTVEAKTNGATLTNGAATFGYNLSAASSNVTITVKDAGGNTVYTGTGTGNQG